RQGVTEIEDGGRAGQGGDRGIGRSRSGQVPAELRRDRQGRRGEEITKQPAPLQSRSPVTGRRRSPLICHESPLKSEQLIGGGQRAKMGRARLDASVRRPHE